MPTSQGGNTNNGNIAVKFFSVDLRDKICAPIRNTEHRENFSLLLQKFNVFLSIVQQTKNKIDPEKLRVIGYNLQIFFKD